MAKHGRCELCGTEAALTFHHLIPRTVHSNKWFRKRYARDEMQQGIDICRQCHSTIHRMIPEKEMARAYNSIETLQAHPEVARYLDWARKKAKRAQAAERRS